MIHAVTVNHSTSCLMTRVMQTHAQKFIVSSKTVNDFTQASHMPEHRAVKDRDCLLLLDELRNDSGMTDENFYESDRFKHQREIYSPQPATD